jgi:hypothetical protein
VGNNNTISQGRADYGRSSTLAAFRERPVAPDGTWRR